MKDTGCKISAKLARSARCERPCHYWKSCFGPGAEEHTVDLRGTFQEFYLILAKAEQRFGTSVCNDCRISA